MEYTVKDGSGRKYAVVVASVRLFCSSSFLTQDPLVFNLDNKTLWEPLLIVESVCPCMSHFAHHSEGLGHPLKYIHRHSWTWHVSRNRFICWEYIKEKGKGETLSTESQKAFVCIPPCYWLLCVLNKAFPQMLGVWGRDWHYKLLSLCSQ